MLKRKVLAGALLLSAVLWGPEAKALSITTSYSLNAQQDGIALAPLTGTVLLPSSSNGLGSQLVINGNGGEDQSFAGIASDSPDNPPNTQGAEIWVRSYAKTWNGVVVDLDSTGRASADLVYHISGASQVHLSFIYLGVANTLGSLENGFESIAGLSLSLGNQTPFFSYGFPSATQMFSYDQWITLEEGIGDLYLRTWASSAALGDNGNASAGVRITNITLEATPVPLPPTILLLGSGLLGMVGLRRFRKS
jgi:hypothetical protein